MRPRALIFDVDGTIADTSKIHESAFKKVFEPFLVKIEYKKLAGKNTQDAIELILYIYVDLFTINA